MIYLKKFTLPSIDSEYHFLTYGTVEIEDRATGHRSIKENYDIYRTCYNSVYPFLVLSKKELRQVDFDHITIFCGGNGSGKTTLLNIIAQKLGLMRTAPYNRSVYFDDYLQFCRAQMQAVLPTDLPVDPDRLGRIITSDDVFNYMLQLREQSYSMDSIRRELFSERVKERKKRFRHIDLSNSDQVERYMKNREMKCKSGSRYVKDHLGFNPQEFSNGESGYQYFIEAIKPGGLYLLDEPENSLSAKLQIELRNYIEAMTRHYDCQFIISSHSPFMVAMNRAKIYDLDTAPVRSVPWHQLENIQAYYTFFKEHEKVFFPATDNGK